MKKRMIWTALIVMVLSAIFGIGSRRYGAYLPEFVFKYAGDTMWALAFFAFFRLVFYSKKLWLVALVTLGFSIMIEVSQLWHPLWLDSIRNTLPGGLLLGFGFLWTDLLCYCVGCMIGLLIFYCSERIIAYRKN